MCGILPLRRPLVQAVAIIQTKIIVVVVIRGRLDKWLRGHPLRQIVYLGCLVLLLLLWVLLQRLIHFVCHVLVCVEERNKFILIFHSPIQKKRTTMTPPG
jgi:hypothetical protein